jgi:tRNA(Arg) A34 adenosine deaminase TadA
MNDDNEINRRDLIVATAGAGVAGALAQAGATPALAEASQLPPGFADQVPLKDNWSRQFHEIVDVDAQIRKDAPDLTYSAGRERHRIYCYLLMKLIARYWNGNKRGPLGRYPQRADQLDRAQMPPKPTRYQGDLATDPSRVAWDRYLGHNIACIAVDGNGEIIDFDFNHNNFFRSTAEHAESRMVRRLFSLTDIFDSWKISLDRCDPNRASQGQPSFGLTPRPPMLTDVTLYTSLESCAQCSGVMSLAGIKQIVYMQNDFTAYKIGNLMYMLANRLDVTDAQKNTVNIPGAPVPIAGSDIELDEFKMLNDGNLAFAEKMTAAGKAKDEDNAFFIPASGKPDFDPSITSFLCTDTALKIFRDAGDKLATLKLDHRDWKPSGKTGDQKVLTNAECLVHANEFYAYADIEGYRGSPHKL